MFVRNKSDAPQREIGGLKTQILMELGDVEGTGLTVTWVDVAPGAVQALHRHGFEQVYIVVAGQGRMQIGRESHEVAEGDFVHVPPDVPHGITTTGDQVLSYISASTPAYRESVLDDVGNV